MNWYYARGEERMGPVDDGQISELARSGILTAQTLVWREGMTDWAPWGHIPHPGDAGEFAPAALQSAPGFPACAECGRTFPAEEMVTYGHLSVCAECKRVFFQRLREGGRAAWQLDYAGFWIRFCARLVDGVILMFVNGLLLLLQFAMMGSISWTSADSSPVVLVVSLAFTLVNIAIAIAYETYFIGRFGATPGKSILNLKVVMSDGGPVTYGRAFGRYFAIWLSQLTFYIGFIIAAFDDQKRALHDHICDTRVVYK